MLPWMHKRNKTIRTMAVCGGGASYPTTIALTDNDTKVTCPNCKREMTVDAS